MFHKAFLLSARSLVLVPLLSCVLVTACRKSDPGPTPDELLRRQKLRESAELSRTKSAEQRLADAESYFNQRNLLEAQNELRSLLISNPDDPCVLLLEAKCRAESGDKLAAVELLASIGDENIQLATEARLLAADWAVEIQRYELAEASLRRLLGVRGDLSEAHRQLATLLNNQGRRIEAAQHLKTLARMGNISEKELFAMNTYSDPFIDVTVAKPDFRGALIPASLAEAKRLRADGELDSARAWVDRLAQAFPQSTPIAAFQGRVYAELQLDAKLSDWMTSLPEGIDQEPEYWQALASWMQRLGRHREAVRCYAEAIARDETDRHSYLGLASSLTLLGAQEEAERVKERHALLAEAASIASRIGSQPGTREELNRMAELLDQLDRPHEAVAWRQVALRSHGGLEEDHQRLRGQRQQLAAGQTAITDDDTGASRIVGSLGIDLDKWPLPALDSLRNPESNLAAGRAADRQPSGTGSSGDPSNVSRGPGAIDFRNIADEVGLRFQYDSGVDPGAASQLLHQMTGGGIGVIDFDLDGWPDLYLSQGGGDAFDPHGSLPNELFRNLSGERWVQVTDPTQTGDTGYGQGVTVADVNQDGFPDLLVANIGVNLLYLNNGDGTFRRQPLVGHLSRSQLDPKGDDPNGDDPNDPGGWTSSIACGDLSGDHLPEIVEINYIDDPSALTIACTPNRDECNPSVFRPAADHVWSIQPDGTLLSWSGCVQMDQMPNYGFAAIITNIDGKHGNDLFIANDTEQNHYWVSQPADERAGGSTLRESAPLLGCAFGLLGQRQGCMGIAYGDFDRSGTLDLHITNFWNQASDLYMQDANGLFSNANASRGLYEPTRLMVGWGTHAIDLDRDGWLDLPVLNGHLSDQRQRGRPYQMRPQLFQGGEKGFTLVPPATLGDPYWSKPTLGRMLATLDWNRDLKPDLVTNHLDAPVALLENRTQTGNAVLIELIGTVSERDAVGAIVTLSCDDQQWRGWVAGGDGILCSNEAVVDFGVGSATSIDRLEVAWPSGHTQVFHDLPVNTRYLIVENEDQVFLR